MYSAAIALLGALTSNAVPSKSEGLLLPAHEYNYFLNIDFFQMGKSSSFAYNTYLTHNVSLIGYFILLYSFVVLVALITLCMTTVDHHE